MEVLASAHKPYALMTCPNCTAQIQSKFCPDCGQPAQVKRINGHYILHEIEHVLHFEKGILYTVRELLLRPGKNVRGFILENRNRLVKPIIFIIITSLIYTLVTHVFHLDDGYVQYTEAKPTATGQIMKWVQDHYGYANIIMGIFIAAWLRLFFRKQGYNFFEILILLCFVMGMGMLFFALFAVFEGLTHIKVMQIAGFVGVAYATWAIARFFNGSGAGSYLKAFAGYLLGMITFMGAAALLGTAVDLLIKH